VTEGARPERDEEPNDDREEAELTGRSPHEPDASPGPRIPPSEPRSKETKRYSVAVDELGRAPLAVTVDQGRVASSYAPADLVAALTEKVQALLRDIGGGIPTMFYGALATNSMTLFFGDPKPEEAQSQFAVEVTWAHANRIAELIDLEDEQLFESALSIGLPAQRYTELTHFVESEGIALHWTPRGEPTRILTPQRAARQHARLSKEPPHDERELIVNGVLYRVITDRQDRRLGTVGIRLHSWSAHPPARHGVRRKSVIAAYETKQVEDSIKAGLIGEPVQALLTVRQPMLGLSIDPEHVELVVSAIESGPTEESRLGPSFLDEPEWE
jgi:hypothetical protein